MTATSDITSYIEEASAFTAENKEQLEIFRLRFLGKKGILRTLFEELKKLAMYS